ncbi:MAG TPA: phage tail protein [Candidatus Angelobacter sp.]|nr:phage tail protein [Candidatus Angelobacter sp.]
MFQKLSQSKTKPTAVDTQIQASVYGATIPKILGTVRGRVYVIWAANLRKGSSGKKGKKSSKKGQPTYVENIDFLLAENPIVAALRAWYNTSNKLDLTFTSLTTTVSGGSPLALGQVVQLPTDCYAVIGVTMQTPYSVTFNDYGGSGSISLSGNFDTPCWNENFHGPDPANQSGYRNFPFIYRIIPGYVVFDNPISVGVSVTIHYAKLINNKVPLAQLRLSFESTLGSGSEYAGFSAQQLLYPQYAGAGSPDLDLGSGPAIPNINLELMGAFPVYASGDADFADMIEAIIKLGYDQAGIDPTTGATLGQAYAGTQGGLSCFNLPGALQKKFRSGLEAMGTGGFPGSWAASTSFGPPQNILDPSGNIQTAIVSGTTGSSMPTFNDTGGLTHDGTVTWINADFRHIQFTLPNTAGNVLVVCASCKAAAITGIQDTAGNTWTAVFPGTPVYQVFYATNIAAANNNVIMIKGSEWGDSGGLLDTNGDDWDLSIFEIAGVDSVDVVAKTTGSGTTIDLSVTTTNDQGKSEYLLGFVRVAPGSGSVNESIPQWSPLIASQNLAGTGLGPAWHLTQQRQVSNPGTYHFTTSTTSNNWAAVLLSFKATQPPAKAGGFGDIIDLPTLNLSRLQSRANGLWGSLYMDSQRKASEWLQELYMAMNAAPVWSGFKLKSIPYSEVSAVGNGAIYNAPTASGPIADLSTESNDFIGAPGQAAVTEQRTSPVVHPDIIQIQHPNRASDYASVTESLPETGSVALYGPRKASPINLSCVYDSGVSRALLGILTRRQAYIRSSYKFKLQPKWALLEPMDLITITDPLAGLNKVPVRITSISEDDKFAGASEAEPFIYGTHAPTAVPVATFPTPYQPPTGATPASVNPPIIFEPVPALYGQQNQQELWLAVSDPDPLYGGCLVEISTDGGNSYNPLGSIAGNSEMGVSTADWPAAADPDTTNDLPVDLTMSLGTLGSYSVAQEDQFVAPCFIETPLPSFVQSKTGQGASPVAVAFTSPNTLHNGILVFIHSNLDTDTIAVSDSQSNTYHLIQSAVKSGSGCVKVFVAYNVAAGANTVTVTGSGTHLDVAVEEWANLALASAFDSESHASGIPGSIATGSITPAQDMELVIAWGFVQGTFNSSLAGFTNRINQSFSDGAMAIWDKSFVAAPSAQSATIVAASGVNEQEVGIIGLKSYNSTGIPYELMSYAVANLTTANKYTLKATGGGTNHLRRAVFAAPSSGQGLDHPLGSRFALLSPDGSGILKVQMDPRWIGVQLFFKFLAFNQFGNGQQQLTDSNVVAYTYTPSGTVGSVNPNGVSGPTFGVNGS